MTWRARRRPRLRLGHIPLLPGLGWPYVFGPQEIAAHKHLIGTTGMGKSKLLASMFAQLVGQGVACALVDPHSDLALDALRLLAEQGYFSRPDATETLWYIDFSRRDAYLPFNILNQPYPSHDIARHLVEVCKRAWPALSDGAAPTFENILLHSVVVLAEHGLSLTALPQLLTDKPYRDGLLRSVSDPQVVRFFTDRYDQWGREGPRMRESTLNRVALLTFSPALRYSLGQRENALDFRWLIDAGVSVIYNLGGLDEDTQRFLGCLLTVGYEVAALSRANLPEEARRPHHVLLDEFSMFSAQSEASLTRVLSMARKYGVFLTLAHQTWSQVSSRLHGALQNTISIAFRLGRSDAEWAARRFGRFDDAAIRHEVADPVALERTHPVYWGLAETFEQWTKALEDLRPREAFVRVGQHTTKIRTLEVPQLQARDAELAGLLERYRARLLRPAEEVMAQVDRLAERAAAVTPARRVRLA